MKKSKKYITIISLVMCFIATLYSNTSLANASDNDEYCLTEEELEKAIKEAKKNNPNISEEELELLKQEWNAAKRETVFGEQIRIIDGVRYLYKDNEPYVNRWFDEGENGSKSVEWYINHSRWVHSDKKGRLFIDSWEKIDDKWYHFDQDGYMNRYWFQDGETWYYLDPENGDMKSGGWIQAGNHLWYYLNDDGSMKKGWVYDNGSWYYLDDDTGSAVWGAWIEYNEKWYLIGANYKMYCDSWVMLNDGSWYYFDESGVMVTGEKQIDGKWYSFDSSGKWKE